MRRSLAMAGWAGAEYLAYPVLMFLATPTLMRHLGAEGFGLWMLVATLVGSWGLANLGCAPTITRYVAMCRDRSDLDTARQIVRFGLGWALLGGGGVALCLILAGPWLATGWLQSMGSSGQVGQALIMAGLMLLLAQVEFSFKAALKGFELFGLAARVELVCKSVLVLVSLGLAVQGMGVLTILLAMLGFSLFSCLVYGWAIARLMGRTVWWPRWTAPTMDMRAFAGWNWLQVVSGVLFHQLDRLLIGVVLGAAPLAAYAVCLQVAQQVHALPAALFSFVLPRMSRGGGRAGVADWLLVLGGGVALALGIPVMTQASWILECWMGADFAAQYGSLLACLTGAYLLLSINVVPHFLNLAAGYARFISILNLLGGIASLILCVGLIHNAGLLGVAAGKFAYGLVLLTGYLYLRRRTS